MRISFPFFSPTHLDPFIFSLNDVKDQAAITQSRITSSSLGVKPVVHRRTSDSVSVQDCSLLYDCATVDSFDECLSSLPLTQHLDRYQMYY